MKAIPILRIFDIDKAKEFYLDWLGFKVDWVYDPGDTPRYLQVSMDDLSLHLTEHHGDCTPGARVFIQGCADLPAYHAEITAKNYLYNRPGLETPFYNADLWEVTVIDPFGNRLTFTGPKE